jgi:hypothetical protein
VNVRNNWSYFATNVLLALFYTAAALAIPPSRFSANGYASDYAIGEMDWMIPISGDRLRHIYFNPAIAYGSDNQGYADLGLGHRWIHNNKTLLGVYLFGGYTRSEHHAHLWVANPGIEAMGRRWDAHLNGYLSMGDRNYHYQDGYDDVYVPTGHQLQARRQLTNDVFHTGNGLDLKLGYQLVPYVPLRGYIGGYYFHAKEVNNIGGGALGLEYWLDDHIKSFVHYTYDNVHHSTGALGIGIELGGVRYHRSNPCIEERLTDPVERSLADLGHGSAIPGQTKHNLNGTPFIESSLTISNIAFFSQTGLPNDSLTLLTIANCTFENPCGPKDFSQTGVDTLKNLLPGTIMLFNGGDYPALNPTQDGPIILRANQRIYSRNSDYSQPATAAERSRFLGAFQLDGNNTLSRIVLLSTPETSSLSGILYDNTAAISNTNILIENSQIGNSSLSFFRGIFLSQTNSSLLINSEVFSSNQALRIVAGNLIAKNSILNVNSTEVNSSTGAVARENASIQLENIKIVVTGESSSISSLLTQITGGSITANHIEAGVTNTSVGDIALTVFNTGLNSAISIKNSYLSAVGGGTSSVVFDAENTAGVTISNSICQLNGGLVDCI